MALTKINNFDNFKFLTLFGNIIEKHEACAEFLLTRRPFCSLEEISVAASEYLFSLDLNVIEEIVLLHPDLVGRIADDSMLTDESQSEQRAAGLRLISKQESDQLAQLNAQYKAKFGFPFIICARENKLKAILEGLKNRLGSEREGELITAREEINKILFYRLQDVTGNIVK